MNITLRARTLPYRPELRYNERVCTRCGILFTIGHKSRQTQCKDCR